MRAGGAVDVANAVLLAMDAGWCDRGRVYRLDARRGLLLSLAARDDDGPALLPRGEALAWRAVESAATAAVGGAVARPLLADGDVVGVAVFGGGEGGPGLDRVLALAGPALRRALDADRARFDAALFAEAMPLLEDGILVVTTDGELRHYGRALVDLVGWTAEEVREHGWTNLVYATPEERADAQTAIAALLMGRPSEGTRRALVRKGGERRVAGIWSRVVKDPAGGAPGLLGVIRDVSRDEADRREAVRDDGLAQLGRITRWVAHDVNNLLCAVGGHAELIELWSQDPRVRRSARTVRESVGHGSRMTRQLLMTGGGPRDVRLVPVGAARVLRETCELFAASAPAGVRVDWHGDEHVAVEADAAQLQQALLNLLQNAGQAMGAAGGRIRAHVERVDLPDDLTFRAATAPPAGTPMVRLTIADDGPGFPEVDPQRLFEPFFTTRREGHGVGLAAVRGIMGSHHGGIRVGNDHGARVELFLPLTDRPEVVFEDLARAHGAAPGRRVWMLDDQPQILEFSRVSLAAQGLAVRDFTSSADLVAFARRTRTADHPDLLVLDAPHGEGVGVLVKLRALGVQAPVLWISGDARDLPPDVAASGRFLAKPFTGSVLAEAAVAMLGR